MAIDSTGEKEVTIKFGHTGTEGVVAAINRIRAEFSKGFKNIRTVGTQTTKNLKGITSDMKDIHAPNLSKEFEESFKKIKPVGEQVEDSIDGVGRKSSVVKDKFAKVEESIDGITKNSSDLRKEFSSMQSGMTMSAKETMKQTATNMRFGDVLSMNMETFKEMSPVIGQYGNRGARAANSMRMLTHGMRGFKMEFLSVMFFGMAMQKFFGGLLQPAMQAAGIFEIISSLLLVLFLPIILDHVLPAVLWLFEKLSGLSEPVKKWLGWVVIAGSIIGTIMAIVGTVFLGAGGTIMTFGGIIAGIISGPIGWMALAIVGLSYLWAVFGNDIKKIIGKVKDWVVRQFNRLKEGAMLALNTLKVVGISILKTLAGDSYDDLVEWKDKLVGVWERVRDTAKEKLEPILDFINDLKKAINAFLDALPDFIKNWTGVGEFRFTVHHEGTGLVPPEALPKTPSMVPKPIAPKSPYEELWEQKEQSIIPLEDFVMTGGRMYKTHPDDTVVGAKGGLGDTYNLNISVSGNGMSNDRELAEKIGEVVTAQLRNVTIR